MYQAGVPVSSHGPRVSSLMTAEPCNKAFLGKARDFLSLLPRREPCLCWVSQIRLLCVVQSPSAS